MFGTACGYMTIYLKYGLLTVLSFFVLTRSSANTVDSLSTKEDVQKFLNASLGKKGIIFPVACAGLLPVERIQADLSRVDTFMVEDPVTREMVMTSVPRDSSELVNIDTSNYSPNYPFDVAASEMEKYPYRFYKRDIDGNGKTDLVVEAGLIVVVMDMVDEFEGHMFSSIPDSNSFRFNDFVSLPDGTTGLLFNYTPYDTAGNALDFKIDTIVYKFHGFSQYNRNSKPANILKIQYHYRRSYGMVSDGEACMEVNKNGQCYFQQSHDDKLFSGRLEANKLNDLWNLIAYIDVRAECDQLITWIDHTEGCMFAVYFDDGTVKRIHIWGCPPPIGLYYVGNNLSDISKVLSWQIAENQNHFKCPPAWSLSHSFSSGCSCSK
jgi:hypothetical protein